MNFHLVVISYFAVDYQVNWSLNESFSDIFGACVEFQAG